MPRELLILHGRGPDTTVTGSRVNPKIDSQTETQAAVLGVQAGRLGLWGVSLVQCKQCHPQHVSVTAVHVSSAINTSALQNAALGQTSMKESNALIPAKPGNQGHVPVPTAPLLSLGLPLPRETGATGAGRRFLMSRMAEPCCSHVKLGHVLNPAGREGPARERTTLGQFCPGTRLATASSWCD